MLRGEGVWDVGDGVVVNVLVSAGLVCVFFRNTEVVALSPILSTCTSKNAIFWSSSFSIVIGWLGVVS